jgi:hypothetical protein
MSETVGNLVGWTFLAAVAWLMVTTLRAIHRDLGFVCTRGFLWALAVVVGNLFGVILYRFFREPVENICATLFARW